MTENKSNIQKTTTNIPPAQTTTPSNETEFVTIKARKTKFYETLKTKEGQSDLFNKIAEYTKEGIKILKQREEEEEQKQKQLQEEYKNDFESISSLYEGVDPETIQKLKEKADQNNPYDENEKRLAGIITYSSKIVQQNLQTGQQQLNKKVAEKSIQRSEEEDLFDNYLWNNPGVVPIFTQSSKIPLHPTQKVNAPPSAPPQPKKKAKIEDQLDELFG